MECNVCGAQFTRLASLVGHIKKHDIRIACVVCGKMVHPNAIELHAKVHANDKPCLSCGKIIHAGRNKTRNKFCSRRCAAKVNNTKRQTVS